MEKQLLGSAPLFLVSDLSRSLDYYCDVLGFNRPRLWGDPPFFAMPDYDGKIIMLQKAGARGVLNNQGSWDAYFWVRDAQLLFDRFRSNGAIVAYEPELRESYGNLEFAVKDPDGYLLAFGQQVKDVPGNASKAATGGGTTRLLNLCPVLPSLDIARDIAWYEEKLGFRNVYDSSMYNEDDRPVDYAVLKRENMYIHLQLQFPEDMQNNLSGIRIEVDNIRPIFEEYVRSGVAPREKLRLNTPWGTNEFGFFDLNRNGIHIYENAG